MMTYTVFLAGISMATFGASGLFFLKLWTASRDRFFIFFSIACGFLSIERVFALFVAGTFSPLRSESSEFTGWIYLIRMTAFIMILIAIVEKNRKKKIL